MSNVKKDKDVNVKKWVLQTIGERDESIRQAFSQFDQKVGQGFQSMEYKIGVLFAIMEELGVSQDKINEIAKNITQDPKGGESDDKQQSGSAPSESVENPTEPEVVSNEGGSEHFG